MPGKNAKRGNRGKDAAPRRATQAPRAPQQKAVRPKLELSTRPGRRTKRSAQGRARGATVTLSYRELVVPTIPVDVTKDVITPISLQAGSLLTYPVMAQVGKVFEFYQYQSLRFHFVPSGTSFTAGLLGMGFDYDPGDAAPKTYQGLSTFDGFVDGKVNSPLICAYRPPPARRGPFFRSPDGAPATIVAQMRQDLPGNFFFATKGVAFLNNATPQPTTLGEIYAEYTVVFTKVDPLNITGALPTGSSLLELPLEGIFQPNGSTTIRPRAAGASDALGPPGSVLQRGGLAADGAVYNRTVVSGISGPNAFRFLYPNNFVNSPSAAAINDVIASLYKPTPSAILQPTCCKHIEEGIYTIGWVYTGAEPGRVQFRTEITGGIPSPQTPVVLTQSVVLKPSVLAYNPGGAFPALHGQATGASVLWEGSEAYDAAIVGCPAPLYRWYEDNHTLYVSPGQAVAILCGLDPTLSVWPTFVAQYGTALSPGVLPVPPDAVTQAGQVLAVHAEFLGYGPGSNYGYPVAIVNGLDGAVDNDVHDLILPPNPYQPHLYFHMYATPTSDFATANAASQAPTTFSLSTTLSPNDTLTIVGDLLSIAGTLTAWWEHLAAVSDTGWFALGPNITVNSSQFTQATDSSTALYAASALSVEYVFTDTTPGADATVGVFTYPAGMSTNGFHLVLI